MDASTCIIVLVLCIIEIAIVFVFLPYIRKFKFCFHFQVNATSNETVLQCMWKRNWVPKILLNEHVMSKLWLKPFSPICTSFFRLLVLKKHNTITVVLIDMVFGTLTGYIPSYFYVYPCTTGVPIITIFCHMHYNLRGSNWAFTMHSHTYIVSFQTLTCTRTKEGLVTFERFVGFSSHINYVIAYESHVIHLQ